jgi:hypothetical protein
MRYRTECTPRPASYMLSARLYPGAELELLARASKLALEDGELAVTNRQLMLRALQTFVTDRETELDTSKTAGTADVL